MQQVRGWDWQSLSLKKSVGGLEAYVCSLVWDNGPRGGAVIKRKVFSFTLGSWVRATSPVSLRADIPASSPGQLLVFLSWRPPGTSPYSSKLYLHRLVEDGLGMSITPLGQRDNSMESSGHHPLQMPSGEPKFLGRILCWLTQWPFAASTRGLESQLGDLGQINSLHLNFFIWKMKMTVPTAKEAYPQGM